TNAVVTTAVKRYDDPNGNGVSIPHHTPELYTVEAFDVWCSVTIILGNQSGEIWSGQQTIPILDPVDRTRNYVQWGPHIVRFSNAGTGRRRPLLDARSDVTHSSHGSSCALQDVVAENHGPAAGTEGAFKVPRWAAVSVERD